MTPEITKALEEVTLAAKRQKAAADAEKSAENARNYADEVFVDAKKFHNQATLRLYEACRELLNAEERLKKAIRQAEGL
jgi:hypothetical protein